jgi:hypothetical protein
MESAAERPAFRDETARVLRFRTNEFFCNEGAGNPRAQDVLLSCARGNGWMITVVQSAAKDRDTERLGDHCRPERSEGSR